MSENAIQSAVVFVAMMIIGMWPFPNNGMWRWAFMPPRNKKYLVTAVLVGLAAFFVHGWIATAVYSLALGVALRCIIGTMHHAKIQRQNHERTAEERDEMAELLKEQREKIGVPVYHNWLSHTVHFLSSSGQMIEMSARDFMNRHLPESEEPSTWIVWDHDVMGGHKLHLISMYGWSAVQSGQSLGFGRDEERRVWTSWQTNIADRYGRHHRFVQPNPSPDEDSVRTILNFITTYESESDFLHCQRAADVANALRQMRRNTRSDKLARAAEVLEDTTGGIAQRLDAGDDLVSLIMTGDPQPVTAVSQQPPTGQQENLS